MTQLEAIHNRLVLMTGWRRFAVAFAAGALTALSTAPLHLFLVCFFTVPVLIWLLDGAIAQANTGRTKQFWIAFRIGWAFGFGYFVAGLWWIANALLVEAREFIWFIPLAITGLPAILAIFYGIACGLARLFWSDGLLRIFVFAAFFGLLELARAYVATGFPWNAIGYALVPTPVLMQSASIFGVSGLNFLAAFVFALPACVTGPVARPVIAAGLIITMMGGHVGFGIWRISQFDTLASASEDDAAIMRIVQPSIDQSIKTAGRDPQTQFEILLDLTSAQSAETPTPRPDIILWPETVIPFILTQSPEAVSAIANRLEPGQILMTGAVRVEGETQSDQALRYYNSIMVLNDEGVITGAADKLHLVPFGEYLPLKVVFETIGLRAIAAADRGYVSATSRDVLAVGTLFSAIPLICYEAIFSRHTGSLADAGTLLVNVSNDAWYGNTPGPYQHNHHARLRSVEYGIPLVRAANSGISGAYDLLGRPVVQPLGYNMRAAIDIQLPDTTASTPYRAYGQYTPGLLFVVLFVIGALPAMVRRFLIR